MRSQRCCTLLQRMAPLSSGLQLWRLPNGQQRLSNACLQCHKAQAQEMQMTQ
jgi:hypothetical protein